MVPKGKFSVRALFALVVAGFASLSHAQVFEGGASDGTVLRLAFRGADLVDVVSVKPPSPIETTETWVRSVRTRGVLFSPTGNSSLLVAEGSLGASVEYEYLSDGSLHCRAGCRMGLPNLLGRRIAGR